MWHRWEYVPEKGDLLRKAAVVTSRVDFLIRVYEEAIAYYKDHQNWFVILDPLVTLSKCLKPRLC